MGLLFNFFHSMQKPHRPHSRILMSTTSLNGFFVSFPFPLGLANYVLEVGPRPGIFLDSCSLFTCVRGPLSSVGQSIEAQSDSHKTHNTLRVRRRAAAASPTAAMTPDSANARRPQLIFSSIDPIPSHSHPLTLTGSMITMVRSRAVFALGTQASIRFTSLIL